MGRKRKMRRREREIRHPLKGVPFKKQSIFYKYLSYWTNLEVRHAIDGMHLKKNVFGNIIGLLPEKTHRKVNAKGLDKKLAPKTRLH